MSLKKLLHVTSFACFENHFHMCACIKAGIVNFVNLPSPPSVVKKVRTGSINNQGT